MAPERLELMERHFRHPGSAAVRQDWALELVDEVRRLQAKPAPAAPTQLGSVDVPEPLLTPPKKPKARK